MLFLFRILFMKGNIKYNSNKTKVTIIGGGNIGTQFACVCASKGYEVNLFTSKPELFDGTIEVIDEHNNTITGVLSKVTNNLYEATENCNVIFVTHPAFKLIETAKQLLPIVKKDLCICVVPGTGGAEFAFKDCIKAGAILCGLQRVPSVARLEQYGKRVRCEGLRNELCVSSIPNKKSNDIAGLMSYLWEIPCKILPNYLCITLTPSNPILHTTRLRTLFANYKVGKIYNRNPLFYGEWNNESSQLLMSCDQELQDMIKKLSKLDLSTVKSLKNHYESSTIEAMTRKLCSIKSLHNLHSPMIKVEGGWIPDFNSRYFTADFPYGLAIIEEFAKILSFQVPNITDTLKWYRKVSGDTTCLELRNYGINSIEDIYSMYGE